MRKRAKAGYWLLIPLLLLAAGATYLRFKVPECQYAQTNQSAYDVTLKCAEGGLAGFLSLFEDWDSERTIALFTVLLVLATLFLWKATRDLVLGAEKTAERQLRAYIGVVEIDLEIPRINMVNPPNIDMTVPGASYVDFIVTRLKNFGDTPAFDVAVFSFYTVTQGNTRLPENFFELHDVDYEPKSAVRTMMARHFLHRWQEVVSKSGFADIIPMQSAFAGQGNLYIFGRIYYRDAFHENRRTTFCYQGEIRSSRIERFVPYEKYNGEDRKVLQ